MSSIKELLEQIPDPTLSTDERVRLRCQLARQFEKKGNYDAACRAMGDVWCGFGAHPNIDSLDERTSGEVLLRVGVLTGWIGSINLIKGAQQIAKNLITESIAIFESLPDLKRVAEAQIEIAYCCKREGDLDAARALYAQALAKLDDADGDLKAGGLLRSAIVERLANRLNDALNLLETAVPLIEASANDALIGCFHMEFALVIKRLGVSERRPDYIERALNEYAAASFHFERAGHARYQGFLENNLAVFLLQVEKFTEAHEHLDRAQAISTRLEDRLHMASFEETRARILLASGEFRKAERVVLSAIGMLEKGDPESRLSEALTTYGVVLARLHRTDEARAAFEHAIKVAEQATDLQSMGLAALTLVEELAEHLPEDELCDILELARNRLRDTQNAELRNRLTDCSYRVLSMIHTARPDWSNFSLDETLRRHEARFVQMALEDSDGSVTKAAELLGLPGHQSLIFILNRRHPNLLTARTPVKPRRRSIIKKRQHVQ